MGFTVEQHPELPLLIFTFTPPFDPDGDPRGVMCEIAHVLVNYSGILYTIHDASGITLSPMEVMHSVAATFMAHTPAGLDRTRIRPLLVGNDEGVHQWAEIASRQQGGARQWLVFASVEEALAAVQHDVATNAD